MGINGVGYMLIRQRQDLRPANLSGIGWRRSVRLLRNRVLCCAVAFWWWRRPATAGRQWFLRDRRRDGRYGRWFPARKWQTADYGNASEGFFAIGSRLFGITSTGIEEIHHASNTWSRTLRNITSPVRVSGNGYAFWTQIVSGKQRLFKFNPDVGAPEDRTPPGMSNVSVVAPTAQPCGRSARICRSPIRPLCSQS